MKSTIAGFFPRPRITLVPSILLLCGGILGLDWKGLEECDYTGYSACTSTARLCWEHNRHARARYEHEVCMYSKSLIVLVVPMIAINLEN